MRPARLALAACALSALALGPVLAEGPATPAPQITDGANDANVLNGQGLVTGVSPVDSGEASYDPADIRSVRYETLYSSVKVGQDGLDYKATGLAIHIGATATPMSDGPTLIYRVDATVGGCGGFLQAFLRGPASGSTEPADKSIQWRTFAAEGCADGDKTSTNTKWTVTLDTAAKELVMTFPFSSLTAIQKATMLEGMDIGGALVGVRTNLSAVAASATAPQIDEAGPGEDFVIGQDMPEDVPCTVGCP